MRRTRSVLTIPKLVCLLMHPGKLLRTSFCCQKAPESTGVALCVTRQDGRSPWVTSIRSRSRGPQGPRLTFGRADLERRWAGQGVVRERQEGKWCAGCRLPAPPRVSPSPPPTPQSPVLPCRVGEAGVEEHVDHLLGLLDVDAALLAFYLGVQLRQAHKAKAELFDARAELGLGCIGGHGVLSRLPWARLSVGRVHGKRIARTASPDWTGESRQTETAGQMGDRGLHMGLSRA